MQSRYVQPYESCDYIYAGAGLRSINRDCIPRPFQLEFLYKSVGYAINATDSVTNDCSTQSYCKKGVVPSNKSATQKEAAK